MIVSARPKVVMSGRVCLGELRGTFRNQAVLSPNEDSMLEPSGHDHLTPVPERVWHGALVDDRDGRAAAAVLDIELKGRSRAANGAMRDLSSQRVGLPVGCPAPRSR